MDLDISEVRCLHKMGKPVYVSVKKKKKEEE